ncbi:MAG: MATE family efflux transporter, partial [Lachnospiraceae bacterium]|nr:MATE family efflux transporter [Lachnospiraceae bacterium]
RLMTMFIAMNAGATAMVARYRGSGQRDKANKIMRQALLLTFILSTVSSVLGYLFARPMVIFMGAEGEDVITGAVNYLKIQMVGFVFMALTSTITASLRGVGDSRTAMIYNLTANVVNVFFNYCLINGNLGFPAMGVEGASLATIIGQFVAFLYAFFYICSGKRYLHLRFRDGFKPDREELGKIAKIGIPSMIEQLVMRAGMIIYAKTVASLGTVAYATHQVCMNIQALSFMTGQAFAVSATSLVGQSLGKRRSDMAQSYCSRTRKIGFILAIGLGLIFFFFGGEIVSLYNDEEQIVTEGARILMLIAFTQPFQTSQFIIAGGLRGAGDTKATATVTFITVLLVRPGLALLLINVFDMGLIGAWIAMVCDQILRTALVMLRYNSGKWKLINKSLAGAGSR